jgi:hypothetical protein
MWKQRRQPVDHFRKDHAMPNGGYPMQFGAQLSGTDLVLHVNGTDVALMRFPAAEPGSTTRPFPVTVCTLTKEQVGGLVYHLLYWNGSISPELRGDLRSGVVPITPQYRTRGCLYDY